MNCVTPAGYRRMFLGDFDWYLNESAKTILLLGVVIATLTLFPSKPSLPST